MNRVPIQLWRLPEENPCPLVLLEAGEQWWWSGVEQSQPQLAFSWTQAAPVSRGAAPLTHLRWDGMGQGWLPPTGPLTLPRPWPSGLEPAPPASALKTHKPIKPGVLIGCDSSFCCLAFGY